MNRAPALLQPTKSSLLRAAAWVLCACVFGANAQQSTPTQAAESILQAKAAADEDRGERRPVAETIIEQRRQGNRVAEIVVTPAGTTYSYTLRNREGRTPLSRQDLSSGLSTPSFIQFEF